MNLRFSIFITLLVVCHVNSALPDDTFETVHTSNAAILNRLGLTPIEIPEGHHKKRVAGPEPPRLSPGVGESRIHQPYGRRHGHRDSHVYVVKLPASEPYYTVTKPLKTLLSKDDDKISTINNNANSGISNDNNNNSNNNNNKNKMTVYSHLPSVGFHSNGKPAKIYHWNLPVMKKINEKKRLIHTQLRIGAQIINNKNAKYANNEKSINGIEEQLKSTILLDKKTNNNNNNNNGNNLYNNKNNNIKYSSLNTNNVINTNERSAAIKHTRNNDKLLNYRENSRSRVNFIQMDDRKNSNDTRKMYRLELPGYNVESIHSNNKHVLSNWNLFSDLMDRTKNISMEKSKKHRKKAAMTYYAPISTAKTGSNNIYKNFAGNGKPKGFYVMEKSRKPIYYHPLLP